METGEDAGEDPGTGALDEEPTEKAADEAAEAADDMDEAADDTDEATEDSDEAMDEDAGSDEASTGVRETVEEAGSVVASTGVNDAVLLGGGEGIDGAASEEMSMVDKMLVSVMLVLNIVEYSLADAVGTRVAEVVATSVVNVFCPTEVTAVAVADMMAVEN